MPRRAINFDTVVKIGLTLPGVEEGTAWTTRALKVDGKMMAFVPLHASAEPGSLGVCIDVADRDELLAAAPEVYYVKPHYLSHACVLVRLARVDEGVLRDLLGMAYKFVTRKPARKLAARKQRKK
jgi:hypothetical protein